MVPIDIAIEMSQDKLKDDPIVEVVMDIRFDTPELPEVVVGRLSDLPLWKGANKQRLPSADIPPPLKVANEALRFLPIIEIRDAQGFGAVRIGASTLSIHFFQPYAGWDGGVSSKLENVLDELLSALAGLAIVGLALRYINVFTLQRHYVESISDLAVYISVGDGRVELDGPINLTYVVTESDQHSVMTKVASSHFLNGNIPEGAKVAAEIGVFTPPDKYRETAGSAIKTWLSQAHGYEKKAFHKLLPKALFEKLRE
jgi:uncharacterized protein (TIGR04255 family)